VSSLGKDHVAGHAPLIILEHALRQLHDIPENLCLLEPPLLAVLIDHQALPLRDGAS
jgi:hypothetical protein